MYVVITGASRGIGLELTRLGLSKGHHVLGIARHPDESEGLISLEKEFKNLSILKLDLLEKDASFKISEAIKSWPKLDILINNAGIYKDDLSPETFEKTFLTNTIKPFFVTHGLFSALKKSSRPVSLQITSQMGSLSDNTSGGAYSYRASKAALNMLFKSLAIDEKWLITLQVHPGWVQTRMGGDSAPVKPADSAGGIWNLIEDADASQSGNFFSFRGETLPW